VNIVLFEPEETSRPLPLSDSRARHILDVLRFGAGDSFDAGRIDGPRGKATIASIDAGALHLEFVWGEAPPPLDPITLLQGLPRPQTARKVLEAATALGLAEMHFVTTDRGEPTYARSKLWTTHEWRRHLIEGASQAFSTRLPRVTSGQPLREAIEALPPGTVRLALDNYESPLRFSEVAATAPTVLALGPERGWSAPERHLLRDSGFQLVHLGERVLRVETACVASIALLKAKLGLM
jgi:16S rRNA (uracil1498-N3)-methyltransferase